MKHKDNIELIATRSALVIYLKRQADLLAQHGDDPEALRLLRYIGESIDHTIKTANTTIMVEHLEDAVETVEQSDTPATTTKKHEEPVSTTQQQTSDQEPAIDMNKMADELFETA
jgi:CHASE3 domain sensor protein